MMNTDADCLAIRDGRIMSLPGFPRLQKVHGCSGTEMNIYARCNRRLFDPNMCTCKAPPDCRDRFDSKHDTSPACPPCDGDEDAGKSRAGRLLSSIGRSISSKFGSKQSVAAPPMEDSIAAARRSSANQQRSSASARRSSAGGVSTRRSSAGAIESTGRRSSAGQANQSNADNSTTSNNVNANSVGTDAVILTSWNSLWDSIRPTGGAEPDPLPALRMFIGTLVKDLVSRLKSEYGLAEEDEEASRRDLSSRKQDRGGGGGRKRHSTTQQHKDVSILRLY